MTSSFLVLRMHSFGKPHCSYEHAFALLAHTRRVCSTLDGGKGICMLLPASRILQSTLFLTIEPLFPSKCEASRDVASINEQGPKDPYALAMIRALALSLF